MKIPAEFHQFTDGVNLLIVTGTQEAVVYKAIGGVLEQCDEIKVDVEDERGEKPGVVINRRKNMVHHGTSLEDKQQQQKEKAVRSFMKELAVHVKELSQKEDITSVYLFTPDFAENSIREELPNNVQDRILTVFHGNFVHEHPLDLVKKVDKFLSDKKIVPTDEEAAKILKRGYSDN